MRRTALISLLLASCLGGGLTADDTTEAVRHDEQTLRDADLSTDDPALFKFFRDRTLSREEQDRLADTIDRLARRLLPPCARKPPRPWSRPATSPALSWSRRPSRMTWKSAGGPRSVYGKSIRAGTSPCARRGPPARPPQRPAGRRRAAGLPPLRAPTAPPRKPCAMPFPNRRWPVANRPPPCSTPSG